MYSLETIKSMNREAERNAKNEGKEPFLIENEFDIDAMPPFPFPYIGDYVPKGWKKTAEFFVDSSGMGADNESALSVRRYAPSDSILPLIEDSLFFSQSDSLRILMN